MRLVQLRRWDERRVALVEGAQLRLLANAASVYEIVRRVKSRLEDAIAELVSGEVVDYEPVYEGRSEFLLLPAFDHPADPAHCLVTGTGLTHKRSAANRASMHQQEGAAVTDSERMYQLGVAGGQPGSGEIGVQPEWFYKGSGQVLRAHNDWLDIPSYAEDGGEEPEVAGVYVISGAGEPLRVGFAIGNEFSDHVMERRNYLYLAPSKLRMCAIGPELTIGDFAFHDIAGRVSIERAGAPMWSKEIRTGEANMCHSLENIEHHHFKFEAHRQPGDVHIHFFGADAFSFGEGLELRSGDVMEVDFPAMGRPLRNRVNRPVARDRIVAAKPI